MKQIGFLNKYMLQVMLLWRVKLTGPRQIESTQTEN